MKRVLLRLTLGIITSMGVRKLGIARLKMRIVSWEFGGGGDRSL